MSFALGFLPESALPAVIAWGAVAVTLGLIRPATLIGWVVMLVVAVALSPTLAALVASLHPLWQLVILAVIGIGAVRSLLGLLFGRRVADHVTALLLYDVFFKLPARLLGVVIALGIWLGRRNGGTQ